MSDRPWLSHYDEGVPHTLAPYPTLTMIDLLRDIVRDHPDDAALLFMGNTISWRELEWQSNAFASALQKLGVSKGDRVALILPNAPQMIIAEFGIWKVGGIAVLLNPLYTGHELEQVLLESQAETVIVLTPFYEKLNLIRPNTLVKRVIISSIKDYLPQLKRFLFTVLKEKRDGHRIILRSGDLIMSAMIDQNSHAEVSDIKVDPEDPALFLFSGGTTGNPKCVIGRHEAMIMTGMQANAWFMSALGNDRIVIMLNLPLFHVYAQVALMASCFVRRSTMVLIPDPRDINVLIATIKRHKVAMLPGVPTLFNALAAHPRLKRDPKALQSLRLIVSGASSLHQETKNRFEQLADCSIIEAYGLTETLASPVCSPVRGIKKNGSVGMPATDVELCIVDAESGTQRLSLGEIGEILIRAPQIMSGYWRNPEETATTLRDGWVYTGDLGYLDEDGYLFIVDRKKDVIKPSGFQVWPREVEEVIASHPMVLETGVAGVPDDYQGEAVKAWIVLHKKGSVEAAELKAHCRKELAAYKVPKHIEFCDSLPKSTVGKVLRRVLVERHKAGKG
ncbi:MAG: long-chain fatty acid--CoA ligase [Chlorobiaceae bacterium]|nr:long-chain fatty acid--CoA ligase [Chlorobiaceae bacterium]